jgi:hypothetical protein
MNFIQRWYNNKKDGRKERFAVYVKERFHVTEQMGKLYLCCNGYAYKEIPGDTTANDVAKELQTAREAALDFEEFRTSSHETY